MTVDTGKRGLGLGDSLSGTAQQHKVGATAIIGDPWVLWNDYGDAIDSKLDQDGGVSSQRFRSYWLRSYSSLGRCFSTNKAVVYLNKV